MHSIIALARKIFGILAGEFIGKQRGRY